MPYSYRLEYRRDGDFDAIDKAVAKLVAGLPGNARNWSIYGALVNLFLEGKKKDNDPVCRSLNDGLAWIRRVSFSEDRMEFELDPGQREKNEAEFVLRRMGLLRAYFTNLELHRDRINELYADKLLDDGGNFRGSLKGYAKDMARISHMRVEERLAEVGKDLHSAGEYAEKALRDIRDLPLPICGWIETTRQLARPLACDELSEFCSNQQFPAWTKDALVDFLVDEMVNRCAKARHSKENKERASVIAHAIGLAGEKVTRALDPARAEYSDLMKKVAKTLKARGTVTSEQFQKIAYRDDVLTSALNRLRIRVLAEAGLTELATALQTAFDPNEYLESMVKALFALVTTYLGRIAVTNLRWVSPKFGGAPIFPLQSLRLLPFYGLDEYRQRLKSGPRDLDEKTGTLNTANECTFHVPLLRISAGQVRLFNARPLLYAQDPGSVLRFVEEAKILDSFSVTRTDDEKRKAQGWRDAAAFYAAAYWVRLDFGFNFTKRYLLVYCWDPANAMELQSHLIWKIASGFAAGEARADDVVAHDYLWAFAGNVRNLVTRALAAYDSDASLRLKVNRAKISQLNIEKLGAFLGLSWQRLLEKGPHSLRPDTAQRAMLRPASGPPVPLEIRPGDEKEPRFGYYFLNWNDDPTNRFVLCQTPYLTEHLKTGLVTRDRLADFLFYYFRRVTDRDKVRKPLPLKNRPLRDDVLDVDVVWSKGAPAAVGVSLPVSMHIAENYRLFRKLKKEWGVIKNKGSRLACEVEDRENAGRVMSAIIPYAGPNLFLATTGSTLSAGALAAAVMLRGRQDSKDPFWKNRQLGVPAWQMLKDTQMTRIPTLQEWCHLKGHGDGGDERIGNFVSGSKHCNTEQLAIESGQRPTTQRAGADFRLNATGYLLPDISMRADDKSDYLSVDKAYYQAAYGENIQDKNQREARSMADRAKVVHNAPVAAFMRYKVAQSDRGARRKGLDYVFEGQSEFIDANQYNILEATAEYLLDEPAFLKALILSYAATDEFAREEKR